MKSGDFSYQQTFDELWNFLQERLRIEGLENQLMVDDEKKQEIIYNSKQQFAEDSTKTIQLHEELATFATAFFLPKNFALVINRYFQDALGDDMDNVAKIIKMADFSQINPPIITFVYGNTGHFLSVTINADQGVVRCTNSFRYDGDFNEYAKLHLLPALKEKFGKDFTVVQTDESQRLRQSDITTCNFHSMLNNIITTLDARDNNIDDISCVVSKIFGTEIRAQNIQELITICTPLLESEEQKANLQKRMVLAAKIYSQYVNIIYSRSGISNDLEGLVQEKTKYHALLTDVARELKNKPNYKKFAELIEIISNTNIDTILLNNFSLNPDLNLIYSKDELRELLFNKSLPENYSSLKDAVSEACEIIHTFCLSIADGGEITPGCVTDTVDMIISSEDIARAIATHNEQETKALQSYPNPSQKHQAKPPLSEKDYNYNKKLLRENLPKEEGAARDIADDFGDLLNFGNIDEDNNENTEQVNSIFQARYGEKADSILHIAALKNDYEMIEILSKLKFNFNTKNADGCNALHLLLDEISAHEIDIRTVEMLLENNINVNDQNYEDRESPLHIACKMSHNPEIIQLLIRKGADVNLKNKHQESILDLAIHTLNNEEDYVSQDFEPIKMIIENQHFIPEIKYLGQLRQLQEKISDEEYARSIQEIISILSGKINEFGLVITNFTQRKSAPSISIAGYDDENVISESELDSETEAGNSESANQEKVSLGKRKKYDTNPSTAPRKPAAKRHKSDESRNP